MGNDPFLCFYHKFLKVSWRKINQLSGVDWMPGLCNTKTLDDLKESHILLKVNLQDLSPLLASHADQQWPLDLGQEKNKKQLCVPFQVYCITAVGNCNCGVWLCWTWPRGRSQKHFPVVICRHWEQTLSERASGECTDSMALWPHKEDTLQDRSTHRSQVLGLSAQGDMLLRMPLQFAWKIISSWFPDPTSAPELVNRLRTLELKRMSINWSSPFACEATLILPLFCLCI